MDVTYRKAHNKECSILAEYIYSASNGVLDYLFKDTVPGMTVIQLLTFGLEDEQKYNSYKGVIVAEYNNKVIGMLQAYSYIHHEIDDESYFKPAFFIITDGTGIKGKRNQVNAVEVQDLKPIVQPQHHRFASVTLVQAVLSADIETNFSLAI